MPPIELFKSKLPVLKDKLDKSILNFYYCGTLSNHKNVKSMIELFKNSKNYDLQLSVITSFSKKVFPIASFRYRIKLYSSVLK